MTILLSGSHTMTQPLCKIGEQSLSAELDKKKQLFYLYI